MLPTPAETALLISCRDLLFPCGGMPFREAHEVVGRLVLHCEQSGRQFTQLTDAELHAISPALNAQALQAITPESAVEARNQAGGTARTQVAEQIAQLKPELSELQNFFGQLGARIGNR